MDLTTSLLLGATSITTDGIVASSSGVGVALSAVDGGPFGEDGGWEATARGVFPTDQGVRIRVVEFNGPPAHDYPCYSGVPGQEDVCWSEDGETLTFIVPALPIGSGIWNVEATSEDEEFAATLEEAFTVVHRSFTTNLFTLRGAQPSPRDVGPGTLADEE